MAEVNSQTLLLGLGGTGSRIVNAVAEELNRRGIAFNDGHICCAVLDTNDNDQKKLTSRGSGIPVVPTSKERSIETYLKMYASKGVREWMPESPSLLKQSMIDGASQMRVKSRLAFYDSLQDRTLLELESHIEKMFNYRDSAKVRVMLVSSLAGGTGSGMFIQTALWLRKFFAKRKCPVTIRGILVLPDVFVKTIRDIREDDTEIQSLYANAYGAIRELNAITKIKTKGLKPSQPVKLDGLFDSELGQPDGEPVFDYAFFLDDISEGGSVLSSIDQYEKVAARLVYMQLYAPMHDDLYSEEDNLFKRFEKSTEPVFGSCGTAKAVYPTADIVRYCALRAAQDSLSTGWRRIDDEIAAKKKKEEEREKAGSLTITRTNPRTEYVRLFEAKTNVPQEKVGSERLFYNIRHDIHEDITWQDEKGATKIEYRDKIELFIERMMELITKKVAENGDSTLDTFRLDEEWAKDGSDASVSLLKGVVEDCTEGVRGYLDMVDESSAAWAEELADDILSLSMGDVNMANLDSVFGLLTKADENNERYFVHPLAVRYLLYKLGARLSEIKQSIVLDQKRGDAMNGYGQGKPKIEFDAAGTSAAESTPQEYLESKALFRNEKKFISTFKNLYSQHNSNQCELCRAYAIDALTEQFAIMLSKRLEALTEQVEVFFKNLVKVSKSLEDAIAENIRKNNEVTQKMVYVCASEEDKEAMYRSLNFGTDNSDAEINKIIVRALFGKFCATENPNVDQNKPYIGSSVEITFFKEVTATYSKVILSKNKKEIDLDIYSAVCKRVDFEEEKREAEKEKEKDYDEEQGGLDVDLETGEAKDGETRHRKHLAAMDALTDQLFDLAAPFLMSDDALPDGGEDEDGTGDISVKKRKTFWGLHASVAKKCPELERKLGINMEQQKDETYLKNELDCYRAVYGIQACNVEKFDERRGGDYYTSYSAIVQEMITAEGNGHPETLIHTPHLDKTWHLFLPYVTPGMQAEESLKFYRLFWLAVAYGMVRLDAKGKYYEIERTRKTDLGSFPEYEAVMFKDEPVGKVDVVKLITALQADGAFATDAAKLEAKFETECEELENYVTTQFLCGVNGKGGLAAKGDLNAVTMIVRYNSDTSRRRETAVVHYLVKALENLMQGLTAGMYAKNETKKIEFKAYELCKRVYDASALKEKDLEVFSTWKEAWAKRSAED